MSLTNEIKATSYYSTHKAKRTRTIYATIVEIEDDIKFITTTSMLDQDEELRTKTLNLRLVELDVLNAIRLHRES